MNETQPTVHLGVDVSKKRLDISAFPGLKPKYPNTPAGVDRLLDDLGGADVVVCAEASGGYEILLLETCLKRGVAASKVPPGRVRHYAKALGIRAKTDRIDAELIARFAEANPPRRLTTHARWKVELAALVSRRDQLVEMRKQEENRLETRLPQAVCRDIAGHLEELAERLDRIDAAIAELVETTAELAGFCERATSVKGVGVQTVAAVMGYMPELGSLSSREAAALAGLAPITRESGEWRGRRFIGGGRAQLRKALYMPAVVAVQHNHVLRAFYLRKRAEGKPAKLALTAVMRKLLILLNRIAANPDFVPDHEPGPC